MRFPESRETMARLSISVLGGFSARLAAAKPIILPTKKSQGLLAYLALRPGHVHARERLATLLWGDSAEDQARHSLRQALFDLRKALPRTKPEILQSDGVGVGLNPATVDVDAARFERLVAEGTPQAMARAADLYRGDLLEGLSLKEEPWEEWLRAERERLRDLGIEALKKLLAHQTEAGATEAAIQTAGRLLALDPLQEAVHRSLMRLYLGQGRRAAALRQYQVCLEVLRRELGVEPEAETRQLYRELLPERPRLAQAPDGASPPVARRRPSGTRRLRHARSIPEAPLIGRGPELEQLRQAMKAAWAGRGQVVAILGEAGIGKTRLIDELNEIALRGGGQVVLGRCYETEQIFPFGPWVDVLRSAIKGHELDGFSPVWQAELSRLLPELGEPGVQAPASAEDHLRLFDAVVRLVRHLASQQPQVLMLDDLHWADEMSLRLLSFLGRRIQGAPVFIVGTSRDDELDGAPLLRRTLDEFDRDDRLMRLTLSPLDQAQTIELVRALAGSGGGGARPAGLGEQVWAASEGNPFMIVETLRALREGGVAPTAGQLPMPQRVRRLISSRLERLGDRARQLAGVAAVIGREFEFGLLDRASGLGEGESAQGVEELVRCRVLDGLGERFGFVHDRIREVTYGQLLAPQRKLLHRQVAEALEELHAGDLAPHYVALATHYSEAEVWDRALTYLSRAGQQASGRSAYREGVLFFERALEALRYLPESRESLEQALDLRLALRVALQPLDEEGRVIEYLHEAKLLAEAIGDRRRLTLVYAFLTRAFFAKGDYDRAIESGHAALSLADALGDAGLQVMPRMLLGEVYYTIGEHRVAIEVLDPNIEFLRGERVYEHFGMTGLPSVYTRMYLSNSFGRLGDFREAITHAEAALRVAEVAGQPHSLTAAHLTAGAAYLGKEDLSRAIELLERGLEISQKWEIVFHALPISSALGSAYALAGHLDKALLLLEKWREAADTNPTVRTLFLLRLGATYLLAERFQDAMASAEQALALARRHGARPFEAQARCLRGEITAKTIPRDAETAERWYRESLAIAEQLGMRPLAARCRVGLGILYGELGRIDDARAELTEAAELFRAMEMTLSLGRVESRLASIDPGNFVPRPS